ncbi:MAG: helix-turn-helix transcriptional regulator [Lentimicrobium sp.]|jgi:transcriptional regulator with XRE-family HTH domain|nr:helix-turn-helix transcriptional regulator [Lentimicrobium sp.]
MTNNIMTELNNNTPIGTMFRQKREEKGLLVRQVAAVIEVDQAIISRIENNDRLPTKEQVLKLAGLYRLNPNEILTNWLAEKMVKAYGDEPYAPEAFEEANNQIRLRVSNIIRKDKA